MQSALLICARSVLMLLPILCVGQLHGTVDMDGSNGFNATIQF